MLCVPFAAVMTVLPIRRSNGPRSKCTCQLGSFLWVQAHMDGIERLWKEYEDYGVDEVEEF